MHAMPVDTCGLIAKRVLNIHDKLVANVHVDSRARKFAIDADDWPHEAAIRVRVDPGKLPVVSYYC
jgi:hypothetical protein